jgi:predicted O-methyltransferase YrrM
MRSVLELMAAIEADPRPFWTAAVALTAAKNVLELGTGDGHAACRMMHALPRDGTLTTINLALPDYEFGTALVAGDPRLRFLRGDTRDPMVVARVPEGIDFLFMDSDHRAEVARAEWALYARKLADAAVVFVDDLGHHDMTDFWEEIPHEKMRWRHLGVFNYLRGSQP